MFYIYIYICAYVYTLIHIYIYTHLYIHMILLILMKYSMPNMSTDRGKLATSPEEDPSGGVAGIFVNC